jgi:hypothetical protein
MNVYEEELRQEGFRLADVGASTSDWIGDYRCPTVKGSSLIVITLTVREADGFLLAARAGCLRDYTPGKEVAASGVVAIEGVELEAAAVTDLKSLVSRLRDVMQVLFSMPLPDVLPRVEHPAPTEYERLLADDGEPQGS